MPFKPDLTTRIKNLHWAVGGVFVTGGESSVDGRNIRYCKATTRANASNWTNLGSLAFTNVGAVYGSSFAKIEQNTQVFVLVGTEGFDRVTNPDDEEHGIIMASTDGREWNKVHEYVNSGWASNRVGHIMGVVWSEKDGLFYASGGGFMGNGGGGSPGLPSGTTWFEEILLTSPDGRSWSQTEQRQVERRDIKQSEYFILPHCNSEVKDGEGKPVPDGVYGKRTAAATILIEPEHPPTIHYSEGVSVNETPSNRVVVETTFDGIKTRQVIDVGFPITSVANNGTFWMAAGGWAPGSKTGGSYGQAMIALSSDDGATWSTVLTESNSGPLHTITAGRTLSL